MWQGLLNWLPDWGWDRSFAILRDILSIGLAALGTHLASRSIKMSAANEKVTVKQMEIMEGQKTLLEELGKLEKKQTEIAEKQHEAMTQELAKRAVLTALCFINSSEADGSDSGPYEYSIYIQNLGTREAREVYWRIALQKAPPGFSLDVAPAGGNVELTRKETYDDDGAPFVMLEGRCDSPIYPDSDIPCAEVRVIYPNGEAVPTALKKLEYVLKCQDGRFPQEGWGMADARKGFGSPDADG